MKVYAQNIRKGDRDYISDEDEEEFCKNLNKNSG